MDNDEFLATVEKAGLPRIAAEQAVQAVLQTLAQRISRAERKELAEALPPELGGWLYAEHPEQFDADAFVQRVANHENTDVETAESHARVVLNVLARALTRELFRHITSLLPRDYERLLPRGVDVEVIPADEFIRRIAQRAGVDEESAHRVAEAVLKTLAERIDGGEVDDLVFRLPVALHAPLRQGKAEGSGVAKRMSLPDFLARIRDREGMPVELAHAHARAVFLTLREAIGDDEFFDVTVQLPDEYSELWAA
jgi:uncharacterized protein (DUF2267 family)